jgi:outer membrane protein assembly factor BamE (lipoprotein component of BamABCDE complex)
LAKLALLVCLIVAVGGVGIGSILRDHTAYAPGFSRSAFALVRPGLSESRVQMLIGRPLREDIGPFAETWYYEPGWWPYLVHKRAAVNGLVVTFGPDGRVADISGAPEDVRHFKRRLRPGVEAKVVLEEAGPPARIEPMCRKIAWYSKQKGNSGRYSIYSVCYDAHDIAVATDAHWDFD